MRWRCSRSPSGARCSTRARCSTCRSWPSARSALAAGHDLDRVLHTDELVSGANCFFVATGITSGDLLRGVRYRSGGAYTQSIVMRSKSGTIRIIDSYHRLEKLSRYSVVDFDGRPIGE